MARPRSFDEHKVLSGAMHCFRALGYRNASVRDLEKATGLTVGSLYNAYGDKDGLFRAALAHYVETVVNPRLLEFVAPGATLHQLERFYLALFEMPYADGLGCLVINSAIEFGSGPSPATGAVDDALDAIETSFRTVLSAHLSEDLVETTVDRLMLLYQGLLMASRAGRAGTTVADAISAEFASLRSIALANPAQENQHAHQVHAFRNARPEDS